MHVVTLNLGFDFERRNIDACIQIPNPIDVPSLSLLRMLSPVTLGSTFRTGS